MCIFWPKIHQSRNGKEEEEEEEEEDDDDDGSTSPDMKSLHKAIKQQWDWTDCGNLPILQIIRELCHLVTNGVKTSNKNGYDE